MAATPKMERKIIKKYQEKRRETAKSIVKKTPEKHKKSVVHDLKLHNKAGKSEIKTGQKNRAHNEMMKRKSSGRSLFE